MKFLEECKAFFPNNFDVKYMISKFLETSPEIFNPMQGGLNRLIDVLEIERIGAAHQAGSDSLVTGLAFFKLLRDEFASIDWHDNFNCILFGLGPSKNEEGYIDMYKSMTNSEAKNRGEEVHEMHHELDEFGHPHSDQYYEAAHEAQYYAAPFPPEQYYQQHYHPMDFQKDPNYH